MEPRGSRRLQFGGTPFTSFQESASEQVKQQTAFLFYFFYRWVIPPVAPEPGSCYAMGVQKETPSLDYDFGFCFCIARPELILSNVIIIIITRELPAVYIHLYYSLYVTHTDIINSPGFFFHPSVVIFPYAAGSSLVHLGVLYYRVHWWSQWISARNSAVGRATV